MHIDFVHNEINNVNRTRNTTKSYSTPMESMLRAIPYYRLSYNMRKIIHFISMKSIPGLCYNNKNELIVSSQTLIPLKEISELGANANNIPSQFSTYDNGELPNDIFIKLRRCI